MRKSVNQPITTTIDLLRHGECEDGHCYRGSIDVALSAKGREQMSAKIALVKPQWQVVVASPLIRCAHFAQGVASDYNLPIDIEDNLREISFGDWEGQSIDMVWKTQRMRVEAWGRDPVNNPPPNGEAADDFSTRVVAGFSAAIQRHRGEHMLLVSHGGVMRALLAYVLSMPVAEMNRFDIPFACLSRIQITHADERDYYRLHHHNINHDVL